jgi:transposase
MARPIQPLNITPEQRKELTRMVASPTTAQRDARRCRIILLRADGHGQVEVSDIVGVNRPVVSLWEGRFRKLGMEGLREGRRSGRRPSISEKVKGQIISEATTPPAGQTQWSTRKMAKAKGVSNQTVHKLWRANGIKPHVTRTFKLSNDKDNYATHKHPVVKSWIKWRNQRHSREHGVQRIIPHFTPTSSSWMNLVERFFRDLTVDCVRNGSFRNVRELAAAIETYLKDRDLNPVRYTWRADGAEILAKIQRAREALNNE